MTSLPYSNSSLRYRRDSPARPPRDSRAESPDAKIRKPRFLGLTQIVPCDTAAIALRDRRETLGRGPPMPGSPSTACKTAIPLLHVYYKTHFRARPVITSVIFRPPLEDCFVSTCVIFDTLSKTALSPQTSSWTRSRRLFCYY